jgi:hypothetical protein
MEVNETILFKTYKGFAAEAKIVKIFDDGRILVDRGDGGARGLDYIKESDIIMEYGK